MGARAPGCPRVVEQHVDPAGLSGSVIHQRLDFLRRADIAALEADTSVARIGDALAVLFIDIARENDCTFGGEQLGRFLANPRPRTGDDHCLSGESHRSNSHFDMKLA